MALPSAQAACGWNKCPADVLYMIFRLLSPAELHELCLVSQHFRTMAESRLYSKIQFTWQESPDYYSPLEPPPPLTQLLRTLLSRPQLADYITNLRLDGRAHALNATRYTLPRIHILEAELDVPVAFIRRTGVPFTDHWIQELRDGSIDALVALLLAQLPRLRFLYFGRAFTRQSALIGRVLNSAVCEAGTNHLPNFEHLEEVSFLHREDRDEACDRKIKNTADILPLFYLPAIKYLSASIQNPDKWAWPCKHQPTATKLTSLDLTNIREAHLGEVLAVTPNLETLRWKWYYDQGVRDTFTTQTVNLDQIATAISHVQKTLTTLTITADCSIAHAIGCPFLPGLKSHGSLKPIAHFTTIKTLQIPWAFLVGFSPETNPTQRLQDVIPRNIESLILTDDLALQNIDYMEPWPAWEWEYSTILDVLEAWLEDEWAMYTPRLRCVTLVLSWIDVDRDRGLFAALGARVGVRLELVELDSYT
ncbi:hypothetical protein BJX99DRAFT_232173 [Aspergillus californicus]